LAADDDLEVAVVFRLSDDLSGLVPDPEARATSDGVGFALLLDGKPSDAEDALALKMLRASSALERARDDAACSRFAPFGEREAVTSLERLANHAPNPLG
jgi:hypothetical protein